MALTTQRDVEPITPNSDYYRAADAEADRPTTTARVVYGLQIALLVVVALLSFAVFWVVGLILNIF